MRYKNATKSVLRFRAVGTDGIKKVFELKSNEEIELGREANLGGLVKVAEKIEKTEKKKRGEV